MPCTGIWETLLMLKHWRGSNLTERKRAGDVGGHQD